METRRDVLLVVGVLAGLNLLLVLGAIALFGRMGPAIDRILQENVASIDGAERILARLATAPHERLDAAVQDEIAGALVAARANVTEPEEVSILDDVAARLERVAAGDAEARAGAVDAVGRLIEVNRGAMQRADEEAQRLGRAGAMAAVLVGVLTFALSLLVARRLERRFLQPITEIHDVLERTRAGDRFRRCAPGDAPAEVREVMTAINALLDRSRPRVEEDARAAVPVERAALLRMLADRSEAAFVVDSRGQVLRANDRALAALAGERGDAIRGDLAALVAGRAGSGAVAAIELGGRAGWLCRLPGADGA